MPSTKRTGNQNVIAKIENIFHDIAEDLSCGELISIPLKYKNTASNSCSHPSSEASSTVTKISFPARTPQEARRFTVVLRILDLIHEALCTNEVVSKRNIYYKDPALFKSQNVVDRYVDIIAYTFDVQRASLNVTAAAKGLVAGDYYLVYSDRTTIRQSHDSPQLIADTNDVQAIDIPSASWILVVEKESTFRNIVSCRLHQTSLAGRGIVLTAKGYPDISTRSFLHHLSLSHAALPIYALTDFDPDGIAVMSTYKHGSWNLSHESAGLIVPRIQWLGMRSGDLLDSAEGEGKGLLRLSARDRRKAMKMLENWGWLGEEGQEGEWRRELQVMLMVGVKGEMEVLGQREGSVSRWVEERLLEHGAGSMITHEEGIDEMLL